MEIYYLLFYKYNSENICGRLYFTVHSVGGQYVLHRECWVAVTICSVLETHCVRFLPAPSGIVVQWSPQKAAILSSQWNYSRTPVITCFEKWSADVALTFFMSVILICMFFCYYFHACMIWSTCQMWYTFGIVKIFTDLLHSERNQNAFCPWFTFCSWTCEFFFGGGGWGGGGMILEVQSVKQTDRFYLTALDANKPSAARCPLLSFVVVKSAASFWCWDITE
jgi:hypothetical protein